jgi:aminopeptidase N
METDNIYLRQAVVTSAPEFVQSLIPYLEEALKDASYLTREYALLRLWSSNPSGIGRYLKALDGQLGFHDLNIRQLWLALAIYATEFRPGDKERFKDELRGYAGPAYSFEVRQKAFEYLTQLGMVDSSLLDALVDAAVHPNWRFRSSARDRLDRLLETGEVKQYFLSHLDGYSDKEQMYLKTVLSK